MVNVAVLRFVAFVTGFLGGLFIIIATPTHHWYLKKAAYNGTVYGGIWEDCTEERDMYSCSRITSNDWLNAVKAFMVLSMLGFVGVTIYLIVMVWAKGLNVRYIALILLFSAANSLIAVSVYTAKRDLQGGFNYSWSYILCWIGTILTAIASLLCFFGKVEYEQMD